MTSPVQPNSPEEFLIQAVKVTKPRSFFKGWSNPFSVIKAWFNFRVKSGDPASEKTTEYTVQYLSSDQIKKLKRDDCIESFDVQKAIKKTANTEKKKALTQLLKKDEIEALEQQFFSKLCTNKKSQGLDFLKVFHQLSDQDKKSYLQGHLHQKEFKEFLNFVFQRNATKNIYTWQSEAAMPGRGSIIQAFIALYNDSKEKDSVVLAFKEIIPSKYERDYLLRFHCFEKPFYKACVQ